MTRAVCRHYRLFCHDSILDIVYAKLLRTPEMLEYLSVIVSYRYFHFIDSFIVFVFKYAALCPAIAVFAAAMARLAVAHTVMPS